MTFLLWSILTVPLMLAFLLIYCCSEVALRLKLIAKSGGSYIAVITAAAGYIVLGGNPALSPLFWGLLLCCIADTLLEIRFHLGVICFGLAHVAFIFWLVKQEPLSPFSIIVLVLIILLFLPLAKYLKNKTGNKLPYYIYPFILAGMAAVAAVLPFTAGINYLCPCLGALIFVFSDYLVVVGFLKSNLLKSKNTRLHSVVVMATYYSALYLLSSSAWLIG